MQRKSTGFWWHELDAAARQGLKRRLSVFSSLTAHAPHEELQYFSINPFIREESLRQVREAIDAAAYLGAQVVSIHPVRKPRMTESEAFDEMVAQYREFGDYAEALGVQVGLENCSFPFTPEYYVDLVKACSETAVGATLDTGHVMCWLDRSRPGGEAEAARYNDLLERLVRDLGENLIHVHLHDVRMDSWKDHRVPGTGAIDWPRFFRNLRGIGYERSILLEFVIDTPQELVPIRDRLAAL